VGTADARPQRVERLGLFALALARLVRAASSSGGMPCSRVASSPACAGSNGCTVSSPVRGQIG